MIHIKPILLKQFFAIILMMLSVQAVTAQKKNNNNKEAEVKQLVESKNFVFRATSASPTGGGWWQLTSEYSFKVMGDTVQANLPYFGRAFSAPLDPRESGIKFLSSQFDYTAEEHRKDGWRIKVEPNDQRDVRQMLLTVSSSGNAILQVISNNRQAITYNGYIMESRS